MIRLQGFLASMGCATLLLLAAAPAFAQDVAILYTDGGTNHVSTLVSDIQATPVSFGSISTLDLMQAIPGQATLNSYDGLLVYLVEPLSVADSETLGDRLADYVEQGGGVVVANSTHTESDGLKGRFRNEHHPFGIGFRRYQNTLAIGSTPAPNHPALDGVSSVEIERRNYDLNDPYSPLVAFFYSVEVAHPNMQVIARYNDPWNTPLVAATHGLDGRVLGLNLYAPSSQTLVGSWDESSDGDRLIANSLHYVTLPGVPLALRNHAELWVEPNENEVIGDDLLSATDNLSTASQIEYELVSTPDFGEVHAGAPLGTGGTFTQQDIDDDQISYTNTNPNVSQDSFDFLVRSLTTGEEIGPLTFVVLLVGPNQPPQLSLPGPQTVHGNDQSILFFDNDGNGISLDDPDAGSGEMRLEMEIDYGTIRVLFPGSLTLEGTNPGAAIVLRGTLAELQSALAGGVRVNRPGASFVGEATFSLFVDDQGHTGTGGPQTDSGIITITFEEPFGSPSGASGCGAMHPPAALPALLLLGILTTLLAALRRRSTSARLALT